jgi:hypothetical protein
MTDTTIVNENDPFLNKNIGVALKGPEWLTLLAFLQHCCTDEDAIKALWDTNNKESFEEIVFMVRQIQRQVFLVHEKLQGPEQGAGVKGKIITLGKKLVGLDGKPLT